jgi:DNA-binding response OmpR family regulator
VERRILVVDDAPDIVHAVRLYLEMEGFTVYSASDGCQAIDVVRSKLPDLVVLDVMMPELDGLSALKLIREISNIPVILLTVRNEEDMKVRGLRLGADDYVTKPFSQRELLGRIQAVLRRSEMPASVPKTQVEIDERLRIDFSRNEVSVDQRVLRLTPTEHRLLYHLISNPGRVLTYENLLAKVWGYEYREEAHYVRLYINYLRQKIESDPSSPHYILTERGLGYRFVDYRRRKPATTSSR